MSQKVAVLGYGVEGKSAYNYFKAKGDDVTLFHKEHPSDIEAGAKVILSVNAVDLDGYDVVVRSPAVRPDSLHTNGRVSSVIQEFFRAFDPKRVIGITGTKGKGTTTSLIYEMLKAAGKTVHVAGNIGVPALDLLPKLGEDDYVVLELSSFQLWDLDISPHIAVLLMIEPEHLDVHKDVQEYVAAKANITTHQTKEDILVYLPSNEMTMSIVNQSRAQKIPYTKKPGAHTEDGYIVIDGQQIVATQDLRLVGPHNVDNACAAVTAAWQVTRDVPALRHALMEFGGLPHRLQFIREVQEVKYYDDSIATTPGSAMAALRSFSQPKVLILGGSDKGADFTELAEELVRLKDGIRGVVLIGMMAPKIQEALKKAGLEKTKEYIFLQPSTMPEIVSRANEFAQPGDVVVMSPSCASFDMFRDYVDRGQQFVSAVNKL